MHLDPTNPVVALCAAGMAAEGEPEEARRLFAQAWDARRDDLDASIAAHFVARLQPTAADTLRWNALAVQHAVAVPDGGAAPLLASLHLNLADSLAAVGRTDEARAAGAQAARHLAALPADGYRDFVAMGIARLQARLAAAADAAPGA